MKNSYAIYEYMINHTRGKSSGRARRDEKIRGHSKVT